MLNMGQKFHICQRSGPRGPIPPLPYGEPYWWQTVQQLSQMFISTMKDFPLSQYFYFLWFFAKFPCMTIFLLVLHYNSGKKIARGGWSRIGTALSGIYPTGFGLYPTSIPPGVIVQKCQIVIEWSCFKAILDHFQDWEPRLHSEISDLQNLSAFSNLSAWNHIVCHRYR